MIKTTIPQLQNVSFYEILRNASLDGTDICDEDWDWGIYLGCETDWSECRDYYDRCMLLFCLNITCLKLNPDNYSVCKVAEFIADNIDAFRQFFNEENREGYRPKDYENSDDRTEDDGFFEAYMEGMESLIAGNYSEEDYEKLYKLLTKNIREDN